MTSEFLKTGYSLASDWAQSLGFLGRRLEAPNIERANMVTLNTSENFIMTPRGEYTIFSIYARENPSFHEQSYGIQVMSPFSQRSGETKYMSQNNAVIQWMCFVDDGSRRISTVDIDHYGYGDHYRHIGIYYDKKTTISNPDAQTQDILKYAKYHIRSAEQLAMQLLLNHVDTDDFDQMLAMLI